MNKSPPTFRDPALTLPSKLAPSASSVPVIFAPFRFTSFLKMVGMFGGMDAICRLPPICSKPVCNTSSKVAGHVYMNGNLRVGQIDILESGLVLSVGIHEQRAADLQEAGGERAVEIVADQADISRDLRALQRYLLKSGLVLTGGWRKQIAANFQQVGVQRTIEAGPEHVDLSPDLCVDETHFVETGLVLVIGVHGQIAADTHLARIQLAVESGAGELDASIDLGAVEVHLTSENAAIAQPQIALGMQTGGIEDAVHQRAFQPDQTVRARADQVNRAL